MKRHTGSEVVVISMFWFLVGVIVSIFAYGMWIEVWPSIVKEVCG